MSGALKISHFVYVIRHPHSYLKIGVASDVEKRLCNLQIGSPYYLAIAHKEEVWPRSAAVFAEEAAHEILSASRTRGGWFKCDVATAIEAVKTAAEKAVKRGESPKLKIITEIDFRPVYGPPTLEEMPF